MRIRLAHAGFVRRRSEDTRHRGAECVDEQQLVSIAHRLAQNRIRSRTSHTEGARTAGEYPCVPPVFAVLGRWPCLGARCVSQPLRLTRHTASWISAQVLCHSWPRPARRLQLHWPLRRLAPSMRVRPTLGASGAPNPGWSPWPASKGSIGQPSDRVMGGARHAQIGRCIASSSSDREVTPFTHCGGHGPVTMWTHPHCAESSDACALQPCCLRPRRKLSTVGGVCRVDSVPFRNWACFWMQWHLQQSSVGCDRVFSALYR